MAGGGRGRREALTGAGILVLAAAIRLLIVARLSAVPGLRYPTLDARAYHEKALAILAGDWLGAGVFYQDPLYPYVLAGLYGLFGEGSVGVLYAQAALDACTALLVYAIALCVFGYGAAVVSGLLASFYAVFLFYDALPLKVPLTVFLISLALFLVVSAARTGRVRVWLGAGFALGLACLTRGNHLAFAPMLIAWVLLRAGPPPRARVAAACAVALGMALAILPFTARNRVVGGDWVLITSQAGQNFYIGNHRGNTAGIYKPPPFVRAHPFFEETDFRLEAERRAGRTMNPSELSRFWFAESFREIAADPGHFARHTARKARLYLSDFEVPDNHSFDFTRERLAPILRLPLPTWGAVLPLALCGIAFSFRDPRARPVLLYLLVYSASVVLFYSMSRYRIAAVPAVLVFAGQGAVALVGAIRERRTARISLGVAIVALGTPLAYLDPAAKDFATYHYNLARGHLGQARIERQKARRQERAGESAAAGTSRARADELENLAEGEYRAGLRVRPGSPRLLASLEELIARRAARLPSGERGPDAPVVEEALRDRARGPPAPDPSP